MDCTKFKQEPSGIGLSTMLVWAREYHMISGEGGARIFFPVGVVIVCTKTLLP